MKTILRTFSQLIAQLVVFLAFFMMLGFFAAMAKESISAVTQFHWIAGVVVGAIWLTGVFALCFAVWYAMLPSAPKWLQNYMLIRKKDTENAGLAEQFPVASFSALMCVAILTAVFALTGVSEILASRHLLKYAVESSHEKPMAELLFRLYMWHTIDMIPFIETWKTYDVKPPLRPENFWAQSTILMFRTAIVGYAVTVIVQVVKFYRKPHGIGDEQTECSR